MLRKTFIIVSKMDIQCRNNSILTHTSIIPRQHEATSSSHNMQHVTFFKFVENRYAPVTNPKMAPKVNYNFEGV